MDILIAELAKYGPTGVMVATIVFLLRGQISDLLKGNSDTAKLIATIEKNSVAIHDFGEKLSDMGDQFKHNSHRIGDVTHAAGEMLSELRAIKDEIIRGTK